MVEDSTSVGRRRGSQIVHGLLIAALLLVVVVRVAVYFRTTESERRSGQRDANADELRQWKRAGEEAFAQEQWGTAVENFRQVVEFERENLRAWALFARSLQLSGQSDPAIAAYLKVSQFGPQPRRWSLYHIAGLYAAQGERDMALDYLQEAVEAGYRQRDGDPPIQEVEEFASLRDDPEFERLAELTKPIAKRDSYRQCDFLIGNWSLLGPEEQSVGTMEISVAESGFALVGSGLETTRSVRWSMVAFFNPELRRWRHIWLDSHGNVIELRGATGSEQSLVLEGELVTADGRRHLAQSVCQELDGGRVRILLQQSADAGNSWENVLDVIMVPRVAPRAKGKSA